jgi:hypothetical protein
MGKVSSAYEQQGGNVNKLKFSLLVMACYIARGRLQLYNSLLNARVIYKLHTRFATMKGGEFFIQELDEIKWRQPEARFVTQKL